MKGSYSRSFKSLRKFLYLNFDYGESRFKSYLGRICCIFIFGTGVSVTFVDLKSIILQDDSRIGASLEALVCTLGL